MKKKIYDQIRVSVNGKRTKFKIGDHIKFNENDSERIITQISVDSDGRIQYLVAFLDGKSMSSMWLSENDFRIMESLHKKPKVIGFGA